MPFMLYQRTEFFSFVGRRNNQLHEYVCVRVRTNVHICVRTTFQIFLTHTSSDGYSHILGIITMGNLCLQHVDLIFLSYILRRETDGSYGR